MEVKLTSFLYLYSLRTGVIFIGTLHLIFAIFSLILLIIAGCVIEESSDPGFRMGLYYLLKSLLIGIITYLIILIALIIVLIIGVKERNVNYVFPYVCMNFMIVIGSIMYSFGHVSLALIVPIFTPLWITYIILFNALVICFQIYIYLVVYSFYHELLQEKYAVGLSNTGESCEIYREKLGYHV